MATLDIRNLSISIKTSTGITKIIENFNLVLNEGEIRYIIGETGSGKTIIAKSILGIKKNNCRMIADRILFTGIDLRNLTSKEHRRIVRSNISFISQDPKNALNPSLKIGQQLIESTSLKNFKGSFWEKNKWKKKQVFDILHKLGIKNPKNIYKSYPQDMPDIITRKIMIAIGILQQPKLLIADDPIIGMDMLSVNQIFTLFEKLQTSNNTTILLLSNDISTIASKLNKTTIMYCGQVVEAGNTQSILKTPMHHYTKLLINSAFDINNMKHKENLPVISGKVPLLQNIPIGCRFGLRCPNAQKKCSTNPIINKIKNHYYLCHFPIEYK